MSRRREGQAKRRRVFYIPGYDPSPPRRYREIYRREGPRQAAISGYDFAMSTGAQGPNGWAARTRDADGPSEAVLTVLVWSDIVKASMPRSPFASYWLLLRTAWIYIGSGTLRRLSWLRKGPLIAAFYPVAMLLFQLAFAGLAGLGVGSVAGQVQPWLGWFFGLPTVVYVLRWWKRRDGRLLAHYLMHGYAFTARVRGGWPPALEERLAAFAAEVARALEEDVDEVLIVGHSLGAALGVSVAADLIRGGRVPETGPAFSLLTLGQVIPMVSFLPGATRLRADLRLLAASKWLTWVDVSAPGDGAAFALCDPVAVSGVAPREGRWPLVLSAAFTRTLAPETWKRLRWKFYRLHFQYLHAFDRPTDYDYFQITAGPLTLAERFEGRAPSRSRIDVPASRYTTIAA